MNTSPPPLAISATMLDNIEEPFAGDLLRRQALAERLTGYVERLSAGAVLALDAPWGEGKTWFTRNWAAQLAKDGWRVSVIDAFEQDYVEDPFLLLAAEIKRLCATDDPGAERFTKKAASVGSALLPIAAKVTINLVGKLAGTNDLVGDFSDAVEAASGQGADEAQAWVRRKLEDHEKDKASVRAFRGELTKFAHGPEERPGKPVVIMIDELDRCRPAFAVRLIERIKHFFDVPNLVFVLVMNRQQLEHALRGVYGPDTDAAAYLGKFLHLTLRLPKERTSDVNQDSQAARFAIHTLGRYRIEGNMEFLPQVLACCVQLFDLSLRDVERICAMRFLSPLRGDGLLACLCSLQLKAPRIYRGLVEGDEQARYQFLKYLEELRNSGRWSNGAVARYFGALIAFARIAAGSGTSGDGELVKDNERLLFGTFATDAPPQAIHIAARSLEIQVE